MSQYIVCDYKTNKQKILGRIVVEKLSAGENFPLDGCVLSSGLNPVVWRCGGH